jgi:hypothetical protein
VVIPNDFQGVWEGWKAGLLVFHAFHTLSFPWPASETRFTGNNHCEGPRGEQELLVRDADLDPQNALQSKPICECIN